MRDGDKPLIIANESDGLHKHFGNPVQDNDGNFHIFTGEAPQHALTSGAGIYHRKVNRYGEQIGGVTQLIALPGFDMRGHSPGRLPNGRIVINYTAAQAPAASPTGLRAMYFDDGDITTLQHVAEYGSIPHEYCRFYGRARCMADGTLVSLFYHKLPNDDMRIVQVETTDGESFAIGPVVYEGPGYNEADMIETPLGHLLVARGAGARIFHSTDNRQTWNYLGVVPGTYNSEINGAAPTIDKWFKDGEMWVTIGITDRIQDTIEFRSAPLTEFLKDLGAVNRCLYEFGHDYENASGYHGIALQPDDTINGHDTACVVFKEFNSNSFSQIRIQPLDLTVRQRRLKNLYLAGTGVKGVNNYLQCDGWLREFEDGRAKIEGRVLGAAGSPIDPATTGTMYIGCDDFPQIPIDASARNEVHLFGINGVTTVKELGAYIYQPFSGASPVGPMQIRLLDGDHYATPGVTKANFSAGFGIYFNADFRIW
jgi:hypothetical protein